MKFTDITIQDALLAGQKIYHEDTCYFLSISGTLMQENAKGRIPAMLSKEDLSATDWSLNQLDYAYDYVRIISEGVLCRFWNVNDLCTYYIFGKLEKFKDVKFKLKHTNIWFDNCWPVSINEVNILDNTEKYRINNND